MNWKNINIDHVGTIRVIDIPENGKLREVVDYKKNNQPLLKEAHFPKGTKYDILQ